MVRIVWVVMMLFSYIAIVSLLSFDDHKHRKILLETLGIISTVVMYGSPFSIIVSIFHGVVTFNSGICMVLLWYLNQIHLDEYSLCDLNNNC